MQLQAVIFDMDGVLIDSEPFWRQAEIEIFGQVGIQLSQADCQQTTGLRIDEVVALRYPGTHPSREQLAQAIVDRVVDLVLSQGRPLPGVEPALQAVVQQGLLLGLASSSSSRLIQATLQRLELTHYFQVIQSAEALPWGKPHPEVYLKAAEQLQVAPQHCLAIEDSLNGLIAAKAASMQAVAIPEHQPVLDPRFCLADYQLTSLLELPALLDMS